MEREPRKRRRRGMTAIVIVSLIVVGLLVAFFLVDAGARSFAEGRVKQELADNLPDSVTGDIDVSIGGVSVIAQYLAGSFDRVTLDGPGLIVDGVPASVRVVATEVPVDRSKPAGDVRGAINLNQKAINSLLSRSDAPEARGAALMLGDGQVTYTGTASLLGFELGYEATATATTEPDAVLLTPTDATVTTGSGSVDADQLLPLIGGQEPIRICLAEYLPEGATLSGVDITTERARILLHADNLILGGKSLTTLGSCAG